MTRYKYSASARCWMASCLQGGVAALLALVSPVLHADDWTDDIQVHGFMSQGFVKTTDNRFFGDSDDGSTGVPSSVSTRRSGPHLRCCCPGSCCHAARVICMTGRP